LPADASVALQESLGFTGLGSFTEVGFKFDEYIDVGYWHSFSRNIILDRE
jgi:phosphinothricin acetyltransferase